MGGGKGLEGLAAAINRHGIFDSGVLDVEVENLHLVFVDHRLVCGLESGDVAASLAEFQTVISTEGNDDITARFSDLCDTGGDCGVSGNGNGSAPSCHATIARDDECQCERLDSGGSLNLRQAVSELGHVCIGSEHFG